MLYRKISNDSSKIKALSEENNNWNKLSTFNGIDEGIIHILRQDSALFIVTYSQKLSVHGALKEFDLNGYLLESYKKETIHKKPVVTTQCIVGYDEEYEYIKNIFIRDFYVTDNIHQDSGYGSIVMEQLTEIAKMLQVEYVYGELSPVDIGRHDNDEEKRENRERVYHFYTKHGFVINEDRKIYLYFKHER